MDKPSASEFHSGFLPVEIFKSIVTYIWEGEGGGRDREIRTETEAHGERHTKKQTEKEQIVLTHNSK